MARIRIVCAGQHARAVQDLLREAQVGDRKMTLSPERATFELDDADPDTIRSMTLLALIGAEVTVDDE